MRGYQSFLDCRGEKKVWIMQGQRKNLVDILGDDCCPQSCGPFSRIRLFWKEAKSKWKGWIVSAPMDVFLNVLLGLNHSNFDLDLALYFLHGNSDKVHTFLTQDIETKNAYPCSPWLFLFLFLMVPCWAETPVCVFISSWLRALKRHEWRVQTRLCHTLIPTKANPKHG